MLMCVIMYAEAANELNKITEARAAVNECVAAHRYMPALTAANRYKASHVHAIVKERQLILCLSPSFQRFKKMGISGTGTQKYWLSAKQLFPIPRLKFISTETHTKSGW